MERKVNVSGDAFATVIKLRSTQKGKGMKRTLVFALVVVLALPVCAQQTAKTAFTETLKAPLDPQIPEYSPVGKLSGEIRSIGADTMDTLMKYWIEDFTKIYPDVHFTVESKGSVTSIPALTAEKADIAPIAREPFVSESQPFEQKFGYPPYAIEVAGGAFRTPSKSPALVFFVNKSNPISKITLTKLDAMLSSTRRRGYKEDIHRWGQLGLKGEWTDAPINIYGIKKPNGIPFHIELRVMKGGTFKETGKEMDIKGPVPVLERIAQAVADDPYGIGYGALANQKQNTKVLALAEKDHGPYYEPTFEAVVKRQYFLSRPIFVYVNRAPGSPLDPKVAEFLKFVLSLQGQQDVVKEGVLLPLTATRVKQELPKLR